MEFRTEVHIPPAKNRINYTTGILFMGSCFTENIGSILEELRFPVDVNPFGVIYNPSSLARNLWALIQGKTYGAADLESDGNRWFSFDHHSRFSDPDRDRCLENINRRLGQSTVHLAKTRFLLITWGTAWVYVNRKTASVVCNCHKLPAARFSRHLLTINRVVDTYTKLFAALRKTSPELHIILSVSPVRHWKDGATLNSVSKSTLILAAHRLSEMFSYCDYFPAFEIAVDDLRDYRFYADDLVHPNAQMTRYIWEKFSRTWIAGESLELSREVRKLVEARNHRPFDPASGEHLDFCRKQLERVRELGKEHPYLDLSGLEAYFKDFLD